MSVKKEKKSASYPSSDLTDRRWLAEGKSECDRAT